MATLGTLVVNLAANATGLVKGLGQATKATEAFSSFAGTAFLASSAAVAGGMVSLAAAAESTAVQFEVMLGSGEKAAAMLATIDKMGAESPFGAINFQDAARTMLQFGVAGDQVLPALKAIGDVAAGDTEKLSRLTLAFSQTSSAGRLMGQDLLQYVNAGFNPLKVISEQTGQNIDQLRKRMEDGAISASEVSAAFKYATGSLGRFSGMTERINKTASGMFMQIKDETLLLARSMGQLLLPMTKRLLLTVQGLVAFFKDYGKTLLLVGTAVTAFVGAITALTLATVAYTKAMVIAQAVSGPKGWAILAIGATAAAVATAAMADSLGEITTTAKTAAAPIGELKGSFADVAINTKAATQASKEFEQQMSKLADMEASLVPKTNQVIGKTKEFADLLARSGRGIVTAMHPMVRAFNEQEAGFTDLMSSMRDELAVLRGDATETSLVLQKMLASGVDPSRVEELKKLFADLEAAKSVKDGKQFFEDKKAEMQSMADSIRQSLKSPEDLLRDKARELDNLVTGGFLSQMEAEQAMRKAKDEMGIGGANDNKKTMTKFAGAMTRGSADAYSTIVSAMSRQSEPTVKAIKEQTKAVVKELKAGQKFAKATPVVQDFNYGGPA